MKYNFCTYFDSVYLAKGLALHESLEKHCPEYHLWVLALDEQVQAVMTNQPNVSVVSLGDFETPELRAACADRTTQERYWTYTPWWIKFVMRHEAIEHLSYIDSDTFFFSDPAPVFEEIGGKGVAITPHRFSPKYVTFIMNGLYNVGLVYLEQGGERCIDEWAELCLEWCYYRHDPNDPFRFCDQKYWDMLVPKHNVHPIQHLGANLAPWNIESYNLRLSACCGLTVEDQPIVWYHFHGLKMYESRVLELHPATYGPFTQFVYDQIYGPHQAALARAWGRIEQYG